MKRFILILGIVISVVIISCAFFIPVPPPTVSTFVMWCETDNSYTEWEVREGYFYCTYSGTVWRLGGQDHDAP